VIAGILASMGGIVPRRGRARAVLVHWKAEEAPERLARLTAAGFEAVLADLAVAPVRELRAAAPDIVVVDLGRLPSHGLAVGLAVRQSASLRPIPLVFVDGAPDKVARVRERIPDAAYASWDRVGAVARRVLASPPTDPLPARSPMDGYSGRPLVAKLGIRPGDRVAAPGAPPEFETALGALPAGTRLGRPARDGADLVVWFPRDRADLERRLARVAGLAGRWLWIAWAKQGSGRAGDLNGNVVREVGLASGLVDSKICAIDATWSGLRFSRRKG